MSYEEELKPLREEINALNDAILELVARRVAVALRIAEVKKRHGKPVVDRSRERVVLDQARRAAERNRLDPDGVERVYAEIIRLCVEAEENQA